MIIFTGCVVILCDNLSVKIIYAFYIKKNLKNEIFLYCALMNANMKLRDLFYKDIKVNDYIQVIKLD